MKIKILLVGKTRQLHLLALMEEYLKRLRHFCTLTVIEVKPAEEGAPAQVMCKEGERLLAKIQPDDYAVTLEIEGRAFSTEQFSRFLAERQEAGRQSLAFVVGGPWGLAEEVRARADTRLSLSKMTFNHEMVRLFLLEQIYRAFTILHHLPYHK